MWRVASRGAGSVAAGRGGGVNGVSDGSGDGDLRDADLYAVIVNVDPQSGDADCGCIG